MNEATKPWLNGKPYYCALCGAGGGERMACEEPDCTPESVEVALARASTATQPPAGAGDDQ
jgi:hypothetical protein